MNYSPPKVKLQKIRQLREPSTYITTEWQQACQGVPVSISDFGFQFHKTCGAKMLLVRKLTFTFLCSRLCQLPVLARGRHDCRTYQLIGCKFGARKNCPQGNSNRAHSKSHTNSGTCAQPDMLVSRQCRAAGKAQNCAPTLRALVWQRTAVKRQML